MLSSTVAIGPFYLPYSVGPYLHLISSYLRRDYSTIYLCTLRLANRGLFVSTCAGSDVSLLSGGMADCEATGLASW